MISYHFLFCFPHSIFARRRGHRITVESVRTVHQFRHVFSNFSSLLFIYSIRDRRHNNNNKNGRYYSFVKAPALPLRLSPRSHNLEICSDGGGRRRNCMTYEIQYTRWWWEMISIFVLIFRRYRTLKYNIIILLYFSNQYKTMRTANNIQSRYSIILHIADLPRKRVRLIFVRGHYFFSPNY